MRTRRGLLEAAGISFSIALLLTLTGCATYWDDGGVAVVGPPPPDVVIFGGDYDRDRDVHEWSHRGHESHGYGHGGYGHGGGGHGR